MSLVNPHALVSDALCLKATELKGNIRTVLQYLITACSCSCHVLKNLAHQAVATTRVRRVHDLHLFLRVSSCVPRLIAEEKFLLTMISIDVFRAQKGK